MPKSRHIRPLFVFLLFLFVATTAFSDASFTWIDRPVGPCGVAKRWVLSFLGYPEPPRSFQSTYGIHIGTPIGQGGMGLVWQATGTNRRGEQVDLIVKRSNSTVGPGPASIEREFRILNHLYPERVRRIEMGDYVYIVTEVFPRSSTEPASPAPTLATWMQTHNGGTPEQRRAITAALLEQVRWIHSQGVIHCDIKPENVLVQVRADGSIAGVRIIDFGIAAWGDIRLTRPPNEGSPFNYGTPIYMSREANSGTSITAERDVRALQRMLLEVHTGRRIFDSPELLHRFELAGATWGFSFRRTLDHASDPIQPELAMVLQSHIPLTGQTLQDMIAETSNPRRFLQLYARRWQRAYAERTTDASRDELALEILRSTNLGNQILPLLSQGERDAIAAAGHRLARGDTRLVAQPYEYHPDMGPDIAHFLEGMSTSVNGRPK